MRRILAIGAWVLGIAAIAKLFSLDEFKAVIAAMGLLPRAFVPAAAYTVISLELVAALSYPIKLYKLCSYLCIALYSCFASFHLWNLANGIGVPCHCFGPLFRMPSWVGLPLCVALATFTSFQRVPTGVSNVR